MEPSSTNRGRELFEAGKIFYGSGELDEEANEPKVCFILLFRVVLVTDLIYL